MKEMTVRGWVLSLYVAAECLAPGAAMGVGLEAMVIPLKGNPAPVVLAREQLAADLAEVPSDGKMRAKSLVTQDGRCVLCGDLFKTGACFALYETRVQEAGDAAETRATMGLAERVKGKWILRGLWSIPVLWREKGWKWDEGNGDDYLPVKPAEAAFELRELSGDAVPEVLVAGEVGKYYQATYVMRYVPETHGLALVDAAMDKPVRAGKWVRLYENSGRRAIWEEWRFSEWVEGDLVERVSWHSEAPYNNIDPPFNEVTVSGGKNPVKIRVTVEDSKVEHEGSYSVTMDGQPYAKVAVTWKPGHEETGNNSTAEDAWFFWKLTGLQRDLFPESAEGRKPAALEKHAEIRVTGGAEARKRFAAGG